MKVLSPGRVQLAVKEYLLLSVIYSPNTLISSQNIHHRLDMNLSVLSKRHT